MAASISPQLDGNFFTRYMKRTMADILPRRFKRLLYVGSAMGVILKQQTVEEELLVRINSNLKLAHSVRAILFPVYFAPSIWRGLEAEPLTLQKGQVPLREIKACELGDTDCWRLGIFLAQHSPDWLQYGSNQLMAADVHDMLVQLPKAA